MQCVCVSLLWASEARAECQQDCVLSGASPRPASLGCWQDSFPRGCRVEILVSLLAVTWGSFSPSRLPTLLGSRPLPPSVRPAWWSRAFLMLCIFLSCVFLAPTGQSSVFKISSDYPGPNGITQDNLLTISP